MLNKEKFNGRNKLMKNTESKSGKYRKNALRSGAFLALIAIGCCLIGLSARASNPTTNATPLPATTGAMTTWAGTQNPSAQNYAVNGESDCADAKQNCDLFTLKVAPGDWSNKRVKITYSWQVGSNDYDMVVRRESGQTPGVQPGEDTIIGSSGNGATNQILTSEEAVVKPLSAGDTIYVRAIYYATPSSSTDQYQGKAEVIDLPPAPVETLDPSACAAPSFDNYQPPVGMPRRNSAGEPSIGVNWNTGNVMAMARLTAYRASFNDSTSPAHPMTGVKWLAKAIPNVVTGLDPILFTDNVTGRTIGGELVAAAGATQGGMSDDDLNTFTNTFQTGGPTQGVDHQTIAGGPPKPGVLGRQPTGSYPNLFYYASQQTQYASVATSFDGGVTYQPAVPAYTSRQCGGLHGHLKVAPDGTVYLPNKNCGGKAAVIVSEDNGLTWNVRKIPTSSDGDDDPSVAIGTGGKVYVAYTAADGLPRVTVSNDRGLTWENDKNLSLGVTGGLRASVFPAAVAGDNNRAMVFFLATKSTNGNNPTGTDGVDATGADPGGAADDFKGTWYPYVAYTCDGGKSWSVVRADNDPLRPGDKNPAQQGVVCKGGTLCPDDGTHDTRNLLDFNDATIDSRGRLLGVYADGCITNACVSQPDDTASRDGNDSTATLTILRQRSGMRLFGAFDPNGPTPPPLPPAAWVESNQQFGNQIKWATPDDGGSPLKSYRIYRGFRGQPGETLIAEVGAKLNAFYDRKIKGRTASVYYRVTAVNALGESPRAAMLFADSKGE